MSTKPAPKTRTNGMCGAPFIQNTLRFPPVMYEAIKAEAAESGRSLHSEILHRLGLSLGEEFNLMAQQDNASILMSIANDLKAIRAVAEKIAGGAR